MDDAFRSHLPRLIADAQSHYGVPGVAVAAVHRDGAIERLVFGADARGVPLDDNSLFAVASLTKLATALAVLHLADSGHLSIDDPLARYLPGAASAQPGVTIRRLLSHTSGLPLEFREAETPYALNLDWPKLARGCQRIALERPPGTRVQYSNVGYG